MRLSLRTPSTIYVELGKMGRAKEMHTLLIPRRLSKEWFPRLLMPSKNVLVPLCTTIFWFLLNNNDSTMQIFIYVIRQEVSHGAPIQMTI